MNAHLWERGTDLFDACYETCAPVVPVFLSGSGSHVIYNHHMACCVLPKGIWGQKEMEQPCWCSCYVLCCEKLVLFIVYYYHKGVIRWCSLWVWGYSMTVVNSLLIDLLIQHNPSQNLSRIILYINMLALKFIWQDKGTTIAKKICKVEKISRIHTVQCQKLSQFSGQYFIGKMRDWSNEKNKNSPKINWQKYSELIFSKDGRTIQWGKTRFSTNSAGIIGVHI